jgi:superfamily II DNA/RNA helicase
MLDMGFIPDIERICKLVPFTRQTLFFSATMPPEITKLADAFLHNPVRIEVARAASTAATISQGLVASASGPAKRETLRRLIKGIADFKNAIIFCNRKRDVAILYHSLQKHGFNAGVLHGDMDQRARMASLDAFKSGGVDLIVCSDVAARGLDIPDVSHVFNFDVPTHAEDYVHRIGRTGRAGKSGVALTIVTPADQKHIQEIERLISQEIAWLPGKSLADLPESREGSDEASHPRGPRSRRASAPGADPARARSGGAPRASQGRPAAQKLSRARPHAGGRLPAEPQPLDPAMAPGALARRHREEDEAPVVGMGDHVPMFLLRPAKVKPAKVPRRAESPAIPGEKK